MAHYLDYTSRLSRKRTSILVGCTVTSTAPDDLDIQRIHRLVAVAARPRRRCGAACANCILHKTAVDMGKLLVGA
jgi:hypothetical protein